MVTRKEVIQCLRIIHGLTVLESPLILKEVLRDYCVVEHKKPVEATENFIKIIFSTGEWLPFIAIALEYYGKHYNINILYNQNNKVILIF